MTTIRRVPFPQRGWNLQALKIGECRTFPCAKADHWLVQRRITASAAYHRKAKGMIFRTKRQPNGVEVYRVA